MSSKFADNGRREEFVDSLCDPSTIKISTIVRPTAASPEGNGDARAAVTLGCSSRCVPRRDAVWQN